MQITRRIDKVCPVVLRRRGSSIEVLAFEHPLAGCQLVKGSVEHDEPLEAAALRELTEESGIESADVVRCLGTWSSSVEGQVWKFFECEASQVLPESWVHHTMDDGGHLFRFFWHPLFANVDAEQWRAVFRGALDFIRKAV